MASKVKAQRISVESFSFPLIVTIGTPDPLPFDYAASFDSWLQPKGCTKQLFKVEAAAPYGHGGCRDIARRLRNSRVPHAGPSKPAARAPESGPVRIQLGVGAASGQKQSIPIHQHGKCRAAPGANPSQ